MSDYKKNPAKTATTPSAPLTASEDAAPVDSAGVLVDVPLGLLGELGVPEEPGVVTCPPLGPVAGEVDVLVVAASCLKASRVLGPSAGGLMTATMPAAQWGLGWFCEQ